MDIYWERQNSGLCRLHSLNAFFGYRKYTASDFIKICNEYDIEKNKIYNLKISCKSFDVINSDQQNIISYILHNNNKYTKYYPINYIYLNKISKDEFYEIHNLNDLSIFFIYNENHIYVIKKHNNRWYTVDSLTGISEIKCYDIYSYIKSKKNHGFIIPINHIKYFYINLELIKNELNNSSIKDYLIKKHSDNQILGNIEVPLNICMDILNYVFIKKNKIEQDHIFNPINNIIKLYFIFTKKFTEANYNNIDLILEYIPYIINELLNIGKN